MAIDQQNIFLENLYLREIKLVTKKAKETSQDFCELFQDLYYGGSYYDKLKIKSTEYEYDLNVVFNNPKSSYHISKLGDDLRKPNFATIQSNDHNTSAAWKNLLTFDRQRCRIISPKEMFKILKTGIDKALTKMDKNIIIDNESYKVTRSEGAPLTLRVKGIERTGVKFSVDLVPSFKLNISDLGIACPDLHDRIKNMIKTHNIYNSQSFMAIALKKENSDMFEIDFHDLERGLVESVGGCVRRVIMLMKYFRDMKGGPFKKLWSYLLKTIVMNQIVEKKTPDYWDNINLSKCFVDCMRELWIGLQKEIIRDTFYPEMNLLERLEKNVVTDCCQCLDKIIKKHLRTERLTEFFPPVGDKGNLEEMFQKLDLKPSRKIPFAVDEELLSQQGNEKHERNMERNEDPKLENIILGNYNPKLEEKSSSFGKKSKCSNLDHAKNLFERVSRQRSLLARDERDVTAAFQLVSEGKIKDIDWIEFNDIEISTVSREVMWTLLSVVRKSITIKKSRSISLILTCVPKCRVLNLHSVSLSPGDTDALVRTMCRLSQGIYLYEDVELHPDTVRKTLVEVEDEICCRRLSCEKTSYSRYKEHFTAWAEILGWTVKEFHSPDKILIKKLGKGQN